MFVHDGTDSYLGGHKISIWRLCLFKNMFEYDLLHRSTVPIEGHVGDESYYGIVLCRFYFLWLAILLGMILVYNFQNNVLFDKSNSENQSYIIGLCLWVIVPFILYTFAKTKIIWYILPIYPPLSIIIGILASKILMKERFLIRTVLLASILFAAHYYEGEIQTYVNNPIPNDQLSLIEKTKALDGVRGYSLYKYHPTRHKAVWAQSAVLTAELVNDLKVKSGDFHAFLKNDRALLLVKKRFFTKRLVTSNLLNIVTSNRWGYILSKEKIRIKHWIGIILIKPVELSQHCCWHRGLSSLIGIILLPSTFIILIYQNFIKFLQYYVSFSIILKYQKIINRCTISYYYFIIKPIN